MRFDRATRGPVGGVGSVGRMLMAACRSRCRRSMGFVATGVAAICLLAACSGDGLAVTTDPATVTAASFPEPSSTVSTSTSPTSTSPTSTSTTVATTPTSTQAPTTTIDPRAKAESEVRAAIDASVAAFSDCLLKMPNCDVVTLEATRRGDMLRINTERVTQWNAAGYAVRDRDTFRYVVEQVELNADLTQATVLVCIADGTKLVQPGAGPGGADVIVDDSYVSGRESWDVRLDADGIWRPYAAPASGPTESRDVCPAS